MTAIFKVGETHINGLKDVRAKLVINHEAHVVVEASYGKFHYLAFNSNEVLEADSGPVEHNKAWRKLFKATAGYIGLKCKRIETPKPKLPSKKDRKKFKKLLAKA